MIVLELVARACFEPITEIDHHDHNPFWGRSILLGGFLASGGDL